MELNFEVEALGEGNLRLSVLDAEDVLWPWPGARDGSAVFAAEDVLSYLADAWPSLLLSETWPDIFEPSQEPRSMTGLLRAAEDRWEQMPDAEQAEVADEEAEIDTFLYRHDLASMKHGSGLGPFYVLRQRRRVRIETNGRLFDTCSFNRFVASLEAVGEVAGRCLAGAGGTAAKTLTRWRARNEPDPALFASFITGLPPFELRSAGKLQATLLSPLDGRSLMGVANDGAEPLLAVARSSGRLGPRGVADVIEAFRALPHGDVGTLRGWQAGLQKVAREMSNPTDQGIRAADWFREKQQQPNDAAVDLDGICGTLGIAVIYPAELDERVDGMASSGPQHGPAILLNPNTARRGATAEDLVRAMRFTQAHELGHLLLDDDEWPALIDTAQQRTPRWIETRANAFATSLLLPAAVAYGAYDELRLPPDAAWPAVQDALNTISARFGVTRIVASRQVARGAPPGRREHLRRLFLDHVRSF